MHQTTLNYPELVRSALLYEGAARLAKSHEQLEEENLLKKVTFGPAVKLIKQKDNDAAVGALLDAISGKSGSLDKLPPKRREFVLAKGNVLASYLTRQPSITFTCPQMKASSVPTLLAIGDHYAPCMPSGSIARIPGATHLWPGSDVESFVARVKAFASAH